ncbi:MAG: UDP-N-acetylmuramoyl-tripeptide--D-alanyl-D-alanine ligase [Planctomycetota bacterium]|nr:UDP-N-acetylmuramoyl-tripeptide--D-alanyl-D-alanine ligase [Planctomycetota bacterium]
MRPMTLEEIRRAVHGRWMSLGAKLTVSGISTDTRTVSDGRLFVALRGERFDAHKFLEAACKAGCPAAIVSRHAEIPPELLKLFPGGLIGVEDTQQALGELAAQNRGLCSAVVVGVTGSNGKTTVKQMIHHILSSRLKGTQAPASFNNAVGVPLTLLGMNVGDDYVVCEIGSSAPGEIASLVRLVRPNIAVITSVAETHLEKLNNIKQVAAEKAAILGGLCDNGLAVVSADSEFLDRALRVYDNVRIVRFGVSGLSDLRLTATEPKGAGQRFELNGRRWFSLPLPGRHNALNALAAIAVAQRMGISQDDAGDALADFEGVAMRLERIDAGGVKIINDAYNANPASMLAAADVLAEGAGRRKVLVAGDMIELGSQAEQIHLRTGREVAERKLDFLIGVGPLGRYIAEGAAEAGLATETFGSVLKAVRGLPGLLRRGDTVLVKGSRAAAMERLVEPIRKAFAKRASGRAGSRSGRSKSKGGKS